MDKPAYCPHCNKEINISNSINDSLFTSIKYLNDIEEDIYTLKDGNPITLEKSNGNA